MEFLLEKKKKSFVHPVLHRFSSSDLPVRALLAYRHPLPPSPPFPCNLVELVASHANILRLLRIAPEFTRGNPEVTPIREGFPTIQENGHTGLPLIFCVSSKRRHCRPSYFVRAQSLDPRHD